MRAIDGDALKRKAQRVATEAWKMKITGKVETILNQFIDWIEDAPTIDPVRKGHWIYHEPFDCEHKNCNPCIECSCCGTWFGADCYAKTPYCPNCGAKMEEGGK